MSDCKCGHSEGYHGSDHCVAEVDLGVRCPCEAFVAASDSCVKPEPPQVTADVLARVRGEVARIEGWDMPYCVDCQDMEVGVDTELVTELADEAQRLYADRRLLGQANLLLARIVAAANVSAIEGADGFVESYSLPVSPIHTAIPFLAEQGIVVTEDGQIKTASGMGSGIKPQGDSQ